ncbi:N-succinylarginine dihydrolase [Planctomycetales bacterium ZRK34]|nr:N-succinylarginine dihydrolase [Planctomycetales bacterium ZRK34]
MNTTEYNFDALVGPTHHFAGLGLGNLASQAHRHDKSNPRAAALQGLAKMRLLMDMGVPQAVLPPHDRPDIAALRRLGFTGDDAAVLDRAYRDDPDAFAACCSASSMWAANAATVCPAVDAPDGLLHIAPANLVTQFHRTLEVPTTVRIFRRIFADDSRFVVHAPLPAAFDLADEGAANHIRLAAAPDAPGIHLFAYGRAPGQASSNPAAVGPPTDISGSPQFRRALPGAMRQIPRQSLAASHAVARRFGLPAERVVFARQAPEVIDAGVFHNDVIALSHRNLMLYHQRAYLGSSAIIDRLADHLGDALHLICIHDTDISLDEAVASYFFNSQLVTSPDAPDQMTLIAPAECSTLDRPRQLIEHLVADTDNPITRARFIDINESMHNGGGPACLRLRIPLSEPDRDALGANVILTPDLADQLEAVINKYYRTELTLDDLRDPALRAESRAALDEFSTLLNLPDLIQ